MSLLNLFLRAGPLGAFLCLITLGPLAAAPGPREKFSLSCVISLSSHAGVQWVLNHDTHDSAERSKSLMFRGKLLTQ